MKHHLKRSVGDRTLTYEELAAVLAQIDAYLNSRPLCPLSKDPKDLMVLTPGHLPTEMLVNLYDFKRVLFQHYILLYYIRTTVHGSER